MWQDVVVDNKSLGAAIATARKAAGLTASAASERVEELGVPIHRVALGKIEAGERVPTVDELIAIAVAFDTSPAALLFGHGLVDGEVEILPNLRTSAIAAMQWLSGHEGLNLDVGDGRYLDANKDVTLARHIEAIRKARAFNALNLDNDDGLMRSAFLAELRRKQELLVALTDRARAAGLIVDDDA